MTLPPDPPDEQPPAPPSPVDASGGECPRCGTHYAPFQEYCLECGLRLPATHGLIPTLSATWRRHISWYPGDWIWPVLAALVVAALAAGIAILATNDNGSSGKTKAAVNPPAPISSGTNPAPPGTESGPSQSTTLPTTEPPTTQQAQPPPPPPPTSGGLTVWPPGQNGWTIVLASIPQSAGRSGAASAARKASAAGLPEVGVLNSSHYSSLHAGYFVIFSGVYTSQTEAKSALGAAKSSYPQAYVRQIVQ